MDSLRKGDFFAKSANNKKATRSAREERDGPTDLLPDLRGWQIFFIIISAVIAEGIFSGDRASLEVAGPAGALVALGLVSLLAISVMACVSELVQLFPVPNAIVEYIEAFVDEDLALCCGVAYWYCWAAVVSGLYLVAVQFIAYWSVSSVLSNILFVLIPLLLIAVNLMGVNAFGIAETIGGILKLLLTFGTGIILYHLATMPGKTPSPLPIDDGFQADQGLVRTTGAALFFVIPSLAYIFLGVESVAVTAFEASSVHSLRGASRWIAWVVSILYAFTLAAEVLVFSWTDPTQPQIYGNTNSTQTPHGADASKQAIPVVVTYRAGYTTLAGFLNGCYIFSAISGANTALYVASRTLYGISRNTANPNESMLSSAFRSLSKTTRHTRVPARAIIVSGVAFFWLPFLIYNQPNADAVQYVNEILVVTSSVMCLIVWAALCLAFLRFQRWFELCRRNINLEQYARFDRKSERYGANTGMMFLQPYIGWFGLVGSLLVVAVFTSATWWNGTFSGAKFALAYTPLLVILALWIVRKLWTRQMHPRSERRGWVKISAVPGPLIATLMRLECNIPDRRERTSDKVRASAPWLFFWDKHPSRSDLSSVNGFRGWSAGGPDGLSIKMDTHITSVSTRGGRMPSFDGSAPAQAHTVDIRSGNSVSTDRTARDDEDFDSRQYEEMRRYQLEKGTRSNAPRSYGW